MAKKTSKPRRSNADIIADVTATLIEQVEAGTPPWIKPWSSSPMAMPCNATTGRQYNGVNILVLWAAQSLCGYGDHRWLTFKQAKKAGGSVRKGQKGTQIIFWRFLEKEDADGNESKIPLARTFTVFNVEQCDGIDVAALPAMKTYAHGDVTPAALADALGGLAGARSLAQGDRAFFDPQADCIRIPELHRFETPEHYASTLCHELVHWTGTKERCDRQFGKRFGDDAYAFEELVAEMGAAFLAAALGIRGELRHAQYLGHWAKIARADTYALTTAAKQAEKAVAFLLEAAGGVEAVEAKAATLRGHIEREHGTMTGYVEGSKGHEGAAEEPAAAERQLSLFDAA